MKNVIKFFAVLLLTLVYSSCEKKEEIKSDKAEIILLELEVDGTIYNSTISGNDISLNMTLPYGTTEAKVKTLSISDGAISSIQLEDTILVSDVGFDITITAQDQINSEIYHLSFSIASPSTSAELLDLTISYNGDEFQTLINEFNATVDKEFAYNASGNVTVNSFTISENAKANITIGQTFDIDEGLSIEVIAQDDITSKTYLLALTKDIDGYLLIEQSSYSSCTEWNTYQFEELMMENNLWNSNNLPPGSFSQCIYQYQNSSTLLFGWEWSFQENQHGVNSFPEIIYGWKPWYENTTTTSLPRKISDLSKLKVIYETEMYIDDGEYNLAFDNWICNSADISPENIRFEFMIWEDRQNIDAFGDYQEDVTTSNGVYKFYMGEPDWEPPGCNWTYLAFVRIENRNSGEVDVDELLNYLVNNNIVSSDNYLASIELGNEIGNSKGYTVFKNFDIEIE